jgi:histidinol-phosphate aminotransferase
MAHNVERSGEMMQQLDQYEGPTVTAATGEPLVRPRPDVAALAPYVPGRPAAEVERLFGLDDVVKLASNENPFGPSPRAVEASVRALATVNSYPDGGSVDLRERLAARFGLARENVAVGNGSDELIALLALAYLSPGDEVVLAAPPYSIHRNAALVAGGRPVGVPLRDHVHDLEAMAGAVTARTKLVFVANPHNPTGTAVDAATLRRFVTAIPPAVLLIVDEAYYDFADDALRHTARDLLDDHPNVVALRTFSKAYGLAGLRAGYALAHRAVVSTLDRVRPPFGLSAVAQAAALAALDDAEYVARVVAQTRAGRARLLEIARRHGLEAIPSQANFVLMHVGDSAGLAEALLRRGVIVRPGENLGVSGWIRVSVGTDSDIDRFEEALGHQLFVIGDQADG